MRFFTHKNRAEKNISQRDNIFSVKGFTLIELVIGIAIIIILAGISVPSFNKFKISQIHNSEVSNALSLLNEARTRATSGDSARSYSVSINNTDKTLTLFRVTTDPGDTAYSEIVTMDNHITLSNTISGETITFLRFTGTTSNTGTITITTTSGSYSRASTIRIYPTGLAALD